MAAGEPDREEMPTEKCKKKKQNPKIGSSKAKDHVAQLSTTFPNTGPVSNAPSASKTEVKDDKLKPAPRALAPKATETKPVIMTGLDENSSDTGTSSVALPDETSAKTEVKPKEKSETTSQPVEPVRSLSLKILVDRLQSSDQKFEQELSAEATQKYAEIKECFQEMSRRLQEAEWLLGHATSRYVLEDYALELCRKHNATTCRRKFDMRDSIAYILYHSNRCSLLGTKKYPAMTEWWARVSKMIHHDLKPQDFLYIPDDLDSEFTAFLMEEADNHSLRYSGLSRPGV